MTIVGDSIELRTTFTVDGVPTNPTAVTLTVRAPDGTTTTPTPANTATGVYEATVSADQAGTWIYRWQGTGTVVGADEGTFYVGHSLLDPPPMLVSLEKAKRAIGIIGTARDGVLTEAIVAATELIITEYEREFLPTAEATRRFTARGRWLDLAPFDLRVATAITRDPDGTATALTAGTDYTAIPTSPQHGVITALELTAPAGETDAVVEITGSWGFAAVPEPVQRACIETVRAITRADPGGWSAVGGDGRPVEPMPQGTYAIPASAHRWLGPYRLYRGVG